ncbi:MAG: TRAP transporter small permease [Burkholderiaceae bacterium]
MPESGPEVPPEDKATEAVALSKSFIGRLVRFFGAVSSLLILIVLALVVYSVIQRYVFNTPLKWGDELAGYLLVALVMFGMAEALLSGHHIAIDLLTSRVGPRARSFVDALSSIAVLAFSLVLGISTWESIRFAHSFGSFSPGYLEVATWIPQTPMLIGAVILGLAAMAMLWRCVARGLRASESL